MVHQTREPPVGAGPASRTRDDEDAAVVVTVLAAIAARAAAATRSEPAQPRTCWGAPAHRISGAAPGPHAWWASGLAR